MLKKYLLVVDGHNFILRNQNKGEKIGGDGSELRYSTRQILRSQTFQDFVIIIAADGGNRQQHEEIIDVKGHCATIVFCDARKGGADDFIVKCIRENQKETGAEKYQQIVITTNDEMLKANIVMVIDGSISIEIIECQKLERRLTN